MPKVNYGSSSAPSALNRYCAGVIEACWLAAVALVPLLYNSEGRDGFEPFKAAFLRLFSIVLFMAWILRAAEKGSFFPTWIADRRNLFRMASANALVVFGVSILVSTAFSVFPLQSLWGSYQQRQGAFTEVCYLVFFFAVATELRSNAQIRRFVTALLVPTIPICLLAIMEHAGLDPLPILGSFVGRASSLAGNPIYLAAYLGMVFPFTVLRIVDLSHSMRTKNSLRRVEIVFYSTVGVLQLTAFLFAGSRGPLLGMVAGVSFLAVAHASRASRGRLLGVLTLFAAIVAFLAVLSIPSGPLAPLARIPVLNRLAGTLLISAPANEVRSDLWNKAFELLRSSEPLKFPSGEVDRWHGLRPLFGYGPETLECVLPLRYSIGSSAPPLLSRFHNFFWDRWYCFGLIGVFALLTLITLTFGAAYERLGLIRSRSDWVRFWIIVIMGVAGLSGGLVARFGSGFLGLGVMCGLALGFTLYVVLFGFSPSKVRLRLDRLDARELSWFQHWLHLSVILSRRDLAFQLRPPRCCSGFASAVSSAWRVANPTWRRQMRRRRGSRLTLAGGAKFLQARLGLRR